MKKSMKRAATVVFFVATVAAAGCFPGVGGNIFVRVDSKDAVDLLSTPTPAVTATPATASAVVDPGQLAREIVKALPTAVPTAPTATPTLPPGERLREGVWSRPRTAEDKVEGTADTAQGSRLIVRLTGKKKDPLVRRPRKASDDQPWVGVGLLGLVPDEQEWLGVTYDPDHEWFRIYGSRTIIIISEEAFLTE